MLPAMAEVIVGFVQPVFTRGIEDVEVHGVFQGPGFMRHIWRNAQDFAGADYEKAVYYPEDKQFLLELDPHVTHYEVLES